MLQLIFLNLTLEHLCLKPEIDLFTTNINAEFENFGAFKLDPGATYIDVFSIDWSHLNFFAFSPILVIVRILSKVKQDSKEGIILVPF